LPIATPLGNAWRFAANGERCARLEDADRRDQVMVEVIFRQTSSDQPRLRHRPDEVHALSPLDVLVDLFGSDPVDLHGAMIVDTVGLAQLVIERLAEAGLVITPADH